MEVTEQMLQIIGQSTPGDFAVYKIQNGKLKTLLVSNDLPRLSGHTPEEYEALMQDDAGAIVLTEDKPMVAADLLRLQQGLTSCDLTYRILHKVTGFTWMHARARVIGSQAGCPVVLVLFLDTSVIKETQEELRRTSVMYEAAASTARFIIWEYDTKTHRVTLQESPFTRIFCKQVGISPVIENAPATLAAYVFDSDRPRFLKMYRDIEAGAPKVSCSFWFRLNSQTAPRFHQVTMMTVFDDKGRPASVYGVGMDMTAQQQEKENYTHMYRQLVDTGLDSIGSFHLNLTKNWCGHGQSKYPSVLKLEAEGTVDGFFKAIASHIPDEAKAKEFAAKYTCQKALEAFHQGQNHLEEEFLVRLSSGDLQWTKAYINLVQNPSTGDIEDVTNSTNITVRKKSEAVIELITREKFDFIGILNLEQHTFEYINIQIAVPNGKLHHKENSETARQYIRPLSPDQKSLEHFDQCTALPNIKAHMQEQDGYTFTYQLLQPEGLIIKQIQYSWFDRISGEVLVAQSDITTSTRQEQNRLRQTQAALKAAEQANRAKTDFVSRISHDIRTPLSAISNMTEFALEDLNDQAKLKNDLLKIRTSNEFLLSLINDILDISKIDSGKVEFNPEPYPYQEYITRIKNMFEPLCAQKNIKFIIMPRLQTVGTMLADKIRINQITLNLISNAIKYTPPGGTVTYISHSRNLPEDRMLFSFEIKDNGIGMSEAFLKVMFEPFTQEHNNPRRPQGLTGTGLGLSIVKHVVDQMGGTLTVKSKLGQGTSVICAIPFPNADLLSKAAASTPVQLPDTATAASSLHGRVLLVEDNKINTEIAQRILTSFGLSLTPAANGLEAVEFFKNSPPGTFGCILMDIQMPFLNGYEATAAIRALRRADAKTIPILAMTADAFAEAVNQSRQAGMNEHVTKPLNPAHLRQVLSKYLG